MKKIQKKQFFLFMLFSSLVLFFLLPSVIFAQVVISSVKATTLGSVFIKNDKVMTNISFEFITKNTEDYEPVSDDYVKNVYYHFCVKPQNTNEQGCNGSARSITSSKRVFEDKLSGFYYTNSPETVDIELGPKNSLDGNTEYRLVIFFNDKQTTIISSNTFKLTKFFSNTSTTFKFVEPPIITQIVKNENGIDILEGIAVTVKVNYQNTVKSGIVGSSEKKLRIKIYSSTVNEIYNTVQAINPEYNKDYTFTQVIKSTAFLYGVEYQGVIEEDIYDKDQLIDNFFINNLEVYIPPSGQEQLIAAPGAIGGNVNLINPLKEGLDTIPEIVTSVINGIVIPLAVPLLAIAIGYSGYLFIAARGNPAKIKDAKDALQWTLIGGAVILGAWVIGQAIQTTIVDLIGSITNNWYA